MLSNNQSAFLSNHSRTTSLHKVHNDLLQCMNDGKLIGVCSLDIRKCFDTISHELLLSKLRKYGSSDNEYAWFCSYMSNRTQATICDGKLSGYLPVVSGIPQGSVLGPSLFLLFLNDMPNAVQDIIINLYADDTLLYYASDDIPVIQYNLQLAVDKVVRWFTQTS